MSKFSSTGLSIHVTDSIVGNGGGTALMLQDTVESYQQGIVAAGGYESASFAIAARQVDIEEWLVYGLGRHVTVYDPTLTVCWEGFVNEVQGNVGPLTVRRGPLTEIANRVIAVYSDATTNVQGTTAAANDTDSQAAYGIWSKVTSGGQVSAANAIKVRDVFLADNAWPPKSQDVSDSGGQSVTVTCRGYNAYLGYPYSEAGAAWTVREKLMDILAPTEEPNAIAGNVVFSTDYTNIAANTLAVPRLEDQNRTGDALIKSLAALGGSADNTRRIWGVYTDRKFWYSAMTTDVAYLMYLSEGVQQIRTPAGVHVEPWNVLPGRWLQFADLLPNAPAMADPYEDMRLMFIESATFTAPRGLSLQGGRTDRLPQLLARQAMLRGV